MSNVLGLRMLPLEGKCINVVEERLTLEGEIVRYLSVSRSSTLGRNESKIVRYSSVSLSPTLGRNEKVEQYIRNKTHKLNALRFWVEGGVIPDMGLAQFSL